MAVQSNFEWLAEGAFVGVLGADADVLALAEVGRWKPFERISLRPKGYVYIHCSGVTRRPDIDNTIVADPAYVTIGAVTSMDVDPTGEDCATLIGLVSDCISGLNIVAQLNAAQDRLYVYDHGVTPYGESTSDATNSEHVRTISVHVRCTSTT